MNLRKPAAALALALPTLMLGGCLNLSVDESSVFVAVPFDAELARSSGEQVKDERAFANADAWTGAWERRARDGWLTPDAPPFIPTQVTHGKLPVDGGELAWTLLKRAGDDRPLIVRCGGNASTRQNNTFVYGATAIPHGDVLLFDYPGSGETGGEASAASFEAMGDALAAFVTQQAAGRDLVMWGHSLGGFVCADLARRLPETDGAILEASARNAEKVAAAWKPWWAGPFVRINVAEGLGGYDNALALKDMKGPVLVLGGKRDRTLPVRLARDVAAALQAQGNDVSYVEFPEGVHSDFPGQADFPGVVAAFFARVG